MSGIISNIRAAFGDVEPAPYTVIVQRAGYEERLYPARRWVCTSMYGSSTDDLTTPMFRRLFCYISGRNEPNVRMDMTTPVVILVEPGAGAGGGEALEPQHNKTRDPEDGMEGNKKTEKMNENGETRKREDDDDAKTQNNTEGRNGDLSCTTPSPSPSYSTKYTMSFLIPASHQEKPPSSSDQDILIEDRPEMTVFVRRFSGFMNDSVLERERQTLYKCIRDTEKDLVGGDGGGCGSGGYVDFTKYYVAQFDPPFKLLGRRNEVWVVVNRRGSVESSYINVVGYANDDSGGGGGGGGDGGGDDGGEDFILSDEGEEEIN